MENWKLQQVCHVRDEIVATLKSVDPAEGKILRLFEYLIDYKIQGLRTPTSPESLHPHVVMKAVYKEWRDADEPKIETALRNLKRQLKIRLEEFSSSGRGKSLPMSIHVVKELWELEVIEQSPAVKRFWEPYFTECTCVRI